MTDVFVSYSRTRREDADRLVAALMEAGVSCWIDRSSIGPAERWRSALREGILDAENLVVLLDEAWAGSRFCREESDLAVEYGKTLIPIVVGEVSPADWKKLGLDVPAEIGARNYIWTSGQSFPDVVRAVVAAVRTDYEWKRLLSRLQERAERWRSSGGAGLLRGKELGAVQRAVARSRDKSPAMTDDVEAFVRASEEKEREELEKVRERARQAESRALAAAAARARVEDPAESLALAAKAWRTAPSAEALEALGKWCERHAHLVGLWPGTGKHRPPAGPQPLTRPVAAVALDDAGGRLASCERLDALVAAGERPTQRLVVQDLPQLGVVDVRTDIEGFAGCAWAGDRLVTIRRGLVLAYRYDVFKERFRQSTRGVPLPAPAAGALAVSPEGTSIAVACGDQGVFVYDLASGRAGSLPTAGRCEDLTWLDDSTLLVAETGGLTRRRLSDWQRPVPVMPAGSGVISVDARGDGELDWVALSFTDRTLLHRPGADAATGVRILAAPDPARGVRLGPAGTAFVYGGGGSLAETGLLEVDVDSGQPVRRWLGGFERAVTAVDPGGGRWLAAGRRDGSVFVWDRAATVLDTDAPSGRAAPGTIEARILPPEPGDALADPRLEVRWGEASDEEIIARIAELTTGPVLPGEVPCARVDETVGVGFGEHLLWFERRAASPASVGTGHTNPVRFLAASPTGALWVSTAMNGRDNSLMELLVWSRAAPRPVLELQLPWLDCSGLSFDESGEVLLLLVEDRVARSLLMDPDRWIERGERLSALDWSRS